jgi:hypothetical protein
MKNVFRTLSMIAVSAVLLNSCKKKFDEYYVDPNRPTNVPASLVLNGVLNDLHQRPWDLAQRWSQYTCCNYNYYGNQEYNWAGASLHYTTLKNVIRMEQEAKTSGAADQNPYAALGKFFRAFFFYQMTMRVGDLPMKDALQALDNPTPTYDTQKEVFKQILTWLDEANADLTQLIANADVSLLGDFYFSNDLRKWQRVVNTFKLRVLISLSKKDGDADLAVKTKFAQVFNNKATTHPLFEGMQDNLQFVYNPIFNKYPVNPDNYGFDATRYNFAATYLNKLSELKDPRVFFVAEPAGKKLKDGLLPTDPAAFVGASSAQDLADMSSKAGTDNGPGYLPGEYSLFNRKKYYSNYTAENSFIVGYPEMCFNIAEAIHRGWITGSAEEWYQKGIQASIGFYGVKPGANDVFFIKAGGAPTNAADYNKYTVNYDFATYYAQPAVQYAGANATGLEQIITQKYLSFFANSGWEAYYNYRRTGVPAFAAGGPGTGNSGLIPKRYQYPVSERNTNNTNWTSAVQAQYAGNDNINAEMWVIKN